MSSFGQHLGHVILLSQHVLSEGHFSHALSPAADSRSVLSTRALNDSPQITAALSSKCNCWIYLGVKDQHCMFEFREKKVASIVTVLDFHSMTIHRCSISSGVCNHKCTEHYKTNKCTKSILMWQPHTRIKERSRTNISVGFLT